MLVLGRKVGEEVLITPPGLRLHVVAIFPQLTLSLTGPRGTLTVHPGGDECQLPGCQVKIKALERHRGRVQLGFTAPRGVKILRGEIAHKGGNWMPVDTTKVDEYQGYVVPDEDVEVCLKVLRTVRNFCLGPQYFDADGAVLLSHAHAKIVDMVERVQVKDAANSQSTDAEQDHTTSDPDFQV